MDLLGSLMDSAKQLAQNAILEKFEGKTAAAQHPLLNMLHDAFAELSDARRKELFTVFEQLFDHYKAQPSFDFEQLWAEIVKHTVIQELAVNVSKKMLSNIMHNKDSVR
ncbi:MAG: hypothetical protein H7249_00290 [Chitinophagaceae bacterium]|nr:hypothetical protein [Oligoflexus sp.]